MDSLRFAVDPALGRLAKWLRFLGFDTVVSPTRSCRPLSNRILLYRGSRNESVARWPLRMKVTACRTPDQLAEVMGRLKVKARDLCPFTRCPVCNRRLEPAGLEDVRDRVPDYVASIHQDFNECLGCGRVFWPGTHQDRIQKAIDRLWSGQNPTD